jgi:hypothetical protein
MYKITGAGYRSVVEHRPTKGEPWGASPAMYVNHVTYFNEYFNIQNIINLIENLGFFIIM